MRATPIKYKFPKLQNWEVPKWDEKDSPGECQYGKELNMFVFSVNKSEKTDFLNHFYKHCMHGKIETA